MPPRNAFTWRSRDRIFGANRQVLQDFQCLFDSKGFYSKSNQLLVVDNQLLIDVVDLNVELAWGTFIIFYDFERTFLTDFKVFFSVTDPMWTEAENNFDQFLDKFIMHELTKDENDNSNNNVSKSNPVSRLECVRF